MIFRILNTLNVVRYKLFGGKVSPWCHKGAICWHCKKSKSCNEVFDCQSIDCPFTRFTF